MFGKHLTLDCYGCDKKHLTSVSFISSTLDRLPEDIGMTKIMPPYVFEYHGKVPEDWGISGVVLIAESHISIHTFPEKEYASIDVFSCKDFDEVDVEKRLAGALGAKSYEKNVLDRGRHFPKNKKQLKQLIEIQRGRA